MAELHMTFCDAINMPFSTACEILKAHRKNNEITP